MPEPRNPIADAFPLARPNLLARAARASARQYRRGRDLPAALPGLAGAAGRAVVPKLIEAEARCEAARRARAPGYRAARHVQLLAALIAEAAAAV